MKALFILFFVLIFMGISCGDDATGSNNSDNCNPKCEDWQTCTDTKCITKSDSCAENKDCTEADKPVCGDDHKCKAKVEEKCGDVVCKDDEECVNDVCKAKTTDVCDNVTCQTNRVCEALGTGSGYDCVCPAPFVSKDNGNCVPAGCEDTACETNEICNLDSNNAPECVCKDGFILDAGNCVADCSAQLCDPDNFVQFCDENKAMQTCRADDRGCGVEIINTDCSLNNEVCIIDNNNFVSCAPKTCSDECLPADVGTCLDASKIIEQCNMQDDGCYDAVASNCGADKFCDINGSDKCEDAPTCNVANPCNTEGEAVCSNNNSGIDVCTRNVDHCLEWVKTSCDADQVCKIDSNSNQPICQTLVTCDDECVLADSKCSDDDEKIMTCEYDADLCLKWSETEVCADDMICQMEITGIGNGIAVCKPIGECNDGIDNDGDGWSDSEDPDCLTDNNEIGFGTTQCNDGVDNNNDGTVDSQDANCLTAFDDDESM